MNVPKLHVDVDQTRARELGLTQQDVANSVLVSLSGSGQVQPNYWVDPKQGHFVPGRNAHARRTSSTASTSINGAAAYFAASRPDVQLLANVAKVERGVDARGGQPHATCSRPSMSTPTCRDATWEASPARSNRLLAEYRAKLAPGNSIAMRGQVESMESAFLSAGAGADLRRRAGLPADGRQFPELARSVHHHHGACRAPWWGSSGRCSCGRRRSACRR